MSELYFDEMEAIREFNITIEDFNSMSANQRQVVTRRYRENERLRLVIKYGPVNISHHSGKNKVVTRKGTKDRYWSTFYYNSYERFAPQFLTPLRLWGIGIDESSAIATHQECLAWLDYKALSL